MFFIFCVVLCFHTHEMMLVSLFFCPIFDMILGRVFIDWFQGHRNNLDLCYRASWQWVQVDAIVCTSWVRLLHPPSHTVQFQFGQADTEVCRTAKKAWLAESHQNYATTCAGFLMIKHVNFPHWKTFNRSSQLSKTAWTFPRVCTVQCKASNRPHTITFL